MQIRISWDQEFDDVMYHLWSKYGRELFTLDGIGDQLDIQKFSKAFFNNKQATADVSIDANANVAAKTGIDYNFEMPKPLRRYNSYFLLWKQLKKKYGLQVANEIIESQLTGDLYINDFVSIADCYSYDPGTTIIIRYRQISNSVQCINLRNLFMRFYANIVRKDDREEIDLTYSGLEVYENNRWVKLTRILRHRNTKLLYRIETKHGNVSVVTGDHPCILEDGTEINAEDLCKGMRLMEGPKLDLSSIQKTPTDWRRAYMIGAMVGDGSLNYNYAVFHQKDVINTSFDELFRDFYQNTSVTKHGQALQFGNIEDTTWYRSNIGTNSAKRQLPPDFVTWDQNGQYGLLAGLIDTDGCVNKHSGVIDIRVISLTLIQQVAQLAHNLGFTRVRTSIAYNYQQHDPTRKFHQKQPLYRVSFAVPVDCPIVDMSQRLTKYKKQLDRVRQKDGRFETNEIIKIDYFENDGWVYDITTDSGKFYSNGLIVHNCFNYSTYDIACNGLAGVSKRLHVAPPKSLSTFLRQVEQFMVVAANSTLGATGFADMLLVASQYVDKMFETGKDGHVIITDIPTYIREKLTEFIYTVNWEFRGNQSPFSNLSIYDDTFLDTLCPDYGANKDTVKLLQRIYLEVMNTEMKRTPLTFPVTTACFAIDENNDIADEEFLRFIAEQNKEYGFINLYNGTTSTLSSCCRLRSERKSEYFNSFGAGSTKIGSLGVATANLPRAAMRAKGDYDQFIKNVYELFIKARRINACKRRLIQKRIDLGAAPLYTNGYMELSKQYSTFGVVGINEAVQLMGLDILEESGQRLVVDLLDHISQWIDEAEAEEHAPHNVEQVPAESSAVKLAKKDKMLGFDCGVPLYSNQFIPLITKADMFDRLRLQGMFDSKLSGGAIAHINVGSRIEDTETLIKLMKYAAKQGVVYWAINYRLNCCKNKHTWVGTDMCPTCGGMWDSQITRVVGFFTTVKNWNPTRREEDWPNRQFYDEQDLQVRE